MVQVTIPNHCRRVEVRGYPKRVIPAIIEHTLRAVLWRMATEGDPDAEAAWRMWAEANMPQQEECRREPLRATMAEMLAARTAG